VFWSCIVFCCCSPSPVPTVSVSAPFIELEVVTTGACNTSVQALLQSSIRAQLLGSAAAAAADASTAVNVGADSCSEVREELALC
jgi:hypothetical protein